MDRNEIKEKIIRMLPTLFPDAGVNLNFFEYVDLIDDLGMDSITFISIMVEIEDLFGLTVPDDMLLMENFRNVDSIIQVIERSVKAGSPNEREEL